MYGTVAILIKEALENSMTAYVASLGIQSLELVIQGDGVGFSGLWDSLGIQLESKVSGMRFTA